MDKANRMISLVDRQATSGKSIKDFCADEGISYATFHYWRRKSRPRPDSAPVGEGFVSLRCPLSAALEVSLPGGLRLSFADTNPEHLVELLERLDRRYAGF
ncbi:IS66 family insertion sequence element accessory protein TnpA [Lewinella sp. IMCC34191]|uniref:IS66 family insertion sequence element accessory protein TnpA n=1 Tax=Lewinella sp. IMCC34191 TaxID=2259172 RepID=UPI001E2A7918|nr:hypothetical protein [Lewinella sp. IMCC34191]